MVKQLTVSKERISLFEHMTFPKFRGLLHDPATILIGIEDSFFPIGLAVGRIEKDVGEILSIFIHPEYRRSGLGKTVLQSLESHFEKQNCKYAHVSYVSSSPILNLLAKTGWSAPEKKMYILHFDNIKIRGSFWNTPMKVPAHAQIFPLTEMSSSDKRSLQEILHSPSFPQQLNFLNDPEKLETINSLGLRIRGVFSGWIASHQISDQYLRYSSLYVREGASIRHSLLLMTEAISRQFKNMQDLPFAIQVIPYKYPKMIHLAKRKLEPFSIKSNDLLESRKIYRLLV